MKIVSSADMREIDRITSERFGVPSLTLMENAGTAVADFTLKSYPSAKSFGVICGKGNNGGDGFVVARNLHEAGKEVRVLLLADPKELKGDAAAEFKKMVLKSKPPPSRKGRGKGGATSTLKIPAGLHSLLFKGWGAKDAESVFDSDVLIDAILGSGFRPPVSGAYAEAIARINASTAPVVAIDVPSGSDSDVVGGQTGAVARADAIVTFTAPRPAHVFGALTAGPIMIAPIGSPDEAIQSSLNLNLITPNDIAHLFAPRPRDSNKGMYGHVLVIGGSLGKAGAAAMAGFAALRAGAGLVTVATPRAVLATVAGYHPELMTEPLGETDSGSIALNAVEHVRNLVEQKTVLAIGPGISRNSDTAELVRAVVSEATIPIVLDADGLNAFEGKAKDLDRKVRRGGRENAEKKLVLTPHPGEMARLTGLTTVQIQRDRVNVARKFAQEHGLILVLKGDHTVVADRDGEIWINPTGNPGMATGGTGDILTGIVAGLIAQNPHRVFEAVIGAVYLHGLAGDIAREYIGEQPLVATDLIKTLADAIRRIRAASAKNRAKIGL